MVWNNTHASLDYRQRQRWHKNKRSFIVLSLFYFQTTKVFRSLTSEFFLVCRKRQREQEIAEEEAAKKKKEWEKEWEVSAQVL